MLVVLDARYPASSLKRSIEVFTSPELPKRPDYVREVASFVHGDHDGYHTLFLLEVADVHLGEYIVAQHDRTVYMATRIPGFTLEVLFGQSIQQAIASAMKVLPK